MQRIFVITLLAVLTAAPMAQAGAWLRDAGTTFLALSFGVTQHSDTTNGFYLEYGLSDQTTVGIDVSTFTNRLHVRNGVGTVFLRRNLTAPDGPNRFAYEVGIGGVWGNEMQRPTMLIGLSWGRSISLWGQNGWVNLDGRFTYEPRLGEHVTKLAGTFGLDFGPTTTGLVELSISSQKGDSFSALEPSLLFKPRHSPFRIKIGTQVPLQDSARSALKLGIWHRF